MSYQPNQRDCEDIYFLIVQYMKLCRSHPYNDGKLDLIPTRDDVANFITFVMTSHINGCFKNEEIKYQQRLQQMQQQQQFQQQYQPCLIYWPTTDGNLAQMTPPVGNGENQQQMSCSSNCQFSSVGQQSNENKDYDMK